MKERLPERPIIQMATESTSIVQPWMERTGDEKTRREEVVPASVTGNYGSMKRKGTQTGNFLY